MITFPDALGLIYDLSLCQKHQLGRTDANDHAVRQRELTDAYAVDERAVGRAVIEQLAVAGGIHRDLRVLARGVAVLDLQIAARLLADQKAVLHQMALPRARARSGQAPPG